MFRFWHYPSLSALPDRRTIKSAAVRPALAGHEPPFGSAGPVAERDRHRDLGDPTIAMGRASAPTFARAEAATIAAAPSLFPANRRIRNGR